MADTDAPNPEAMVDEAPGPVRRLVQQMVPATRDGRIAAATAVAIIVGVPGTLGLGAANRTRHIVHG